MAWWRRTEPHRVFLHVLMLVFGAATLLATPRADSFTTHVKPVWLVYVWGVMLVGGGMAGIAAACAISDPLRTYAAERAALWIENAAILWALMTAAAIGFAEFFSSVWLLALVASNVWRDLQIAFGLRESRDRSQAQAQE